MGKAGKQSCLLPIYLALRVRLVRLTHGVKYYLVKRHCAKSLGHWALHYLLHTVTFAKHGCIGQQTWTRLTHAVGMFGNKEPRLRLPSTPGINNTTDFSSMCLYTR